MPKLNNNSSDFDIPDTEAIQPVRINVWSVEIYRDLLDAAIENYTQNSESENEFDVRYFISEKELIKEFMRTEAEYAPDMFYCSPWGYKQITAESANSFVVLNDKISSGAFISSSLESVMYDGNIIGVPFNNNVAALYIRNDLLQKYGEELPADCTWDDFIDLGKRLRDAHSIYLFAINDIALRVLMQSTGHLFYDENGNVVPTGSDDVFRFLQALVEEELIYPSPVNDDYELMTLIKNDVVFSCIGLPHFYKLISNYLDDTQSEIMFGVMPLPKSEAMPYDVGLGSDAWMFTTKENVDVFNAAWDFVSQSFINDTEFMQQMSEQYYLVPVLYSVINGMTNESLSEYFNTNVLKFLGNLGEDTYNVYYGDKVEEIQREFIYYAKDIVNNVIDADGAYMQFVGYCDILNDLPSGGPDENEVEKIDVTVLPKKTEYKEFDKFCTEGMVVIATYMDGSERKLTSYAYSPDVVTDDTREVTIFYTDKIKTVKTSVNITVSKRILKDISVNVANDRFLVSKVISPNQFSVTAIYHDDFSRPVTGFSFYPSVFDSSGSKSITFKYSEDLIQVETVKNITVNKLLESIEIMERPKHTTYYNGERFDATGLKVVGNYSGGIQEILSVGSLYFDPQVVKFNDGETAKSIEIKYIDRGVSKSCYLTVYKQTGAELSDCDITQEFGYCGSGAVNLSSGELKYKFRDFVGGDNNFPITISRVYNSNAADYSYVGLRWRLNLQQQIVFNSDKWTYIDKNGDEHEFENGYKQEVGRSSIRNTALGLDLFNELDNENNRCVILVDRDKNSLVFTDVGSRYLLTKIIKFPATFTTPITELTLNIEYDQSGRIQSVCGGRIQNGKRPTVNFLYEKGLLSSLTYSCVKSTTVVKYVYKNNVLSEIVQTNDNVVSPKNTVTEFLTDEHLFKAIDRAKSNGEQNFKYLQYRFDDFGRVYNIKSGYGDLVDDEINVSYINNVRNVVSDSETDIIAYTLVSQNGETTVTSFSKKCMVSQCGYCTSGSDGKNKPKYVTEATSRGYSYDRLADTYSDTLDIFHDSFENGVAGWSGGIVNNDISIHGNSSLCGKKLTKTYTYKTSNKNGDTLYLSLWAMCQNAIKLNVEVSGDRGRGDFTHNLYRGLNFWQFTAFGLGRIANGEKIKITVSSDIDICIDDIRLTKAPYEIPDKIPENEYSDFGKLKKSYEYDPVSDIIRCTEFIYNNDDLLIGERVTSNNDGSQLQYTEYSYINGLKQSGMQFGKQTSDFLKEQYTYADYRPIKYIDSNGVVTTYLYGQDWSQSTVVGGDGSAAVVTKNTDFTDTDVTDTISSGALQNKYEYNNSGSLVKARFGYQSGNGTYESVMFFDYDSYGNLSGVKIGEDLITSLVYNTKHLTEITYGNAGSIEYTYDGKDRVTSVTEGGATTTFTYSDDAQSMTTAANGVYTYCSKTVNNGGVTKEYSVGFVGETRIFKTVGLAAKAAGSVATAENYIDNGEIPFEHRVVTMDSDGRIVKIVRDGHGANGEYRYDDLYRLSTKITSFGDVQFMNNYGYKTLKTERQQTSNLVATEAYHVKGITQQRATYDYYDNGNLKMVATDKNVMYAYDEHNRLQCEDNYLLGNRYKYYYDSNGNITKRETFAINNGVISSSPTKTDNYGYDAVVGVAQNGAWRDQLKSYNGVAIAYDTCGNPTNIMGKTMKWTCRRLTEVDGLQMSYDYNGLRVKKGESLFYWQNDNIMAELRRIGGTESYFYYYYDETGICGFNCDGVDYLFQKNFLGDVLAIYNKNGELQCKYVYDAWGNHRIYDANGNEVPDDGASIGSKNPIRYRGYYWDREFCMYYLKSRYYCPEIGRYISPDSVEYLDPKSIIGFNLYAYCSDNPAMAFDPYGTLVMLILSGILLVGGVIGGTVAGVKSYKSGRRGWDFLADIMFGFVVGVAITAAVMTFVGVAVVAMSTSASILFKDMAVLGMAMFNITCILLGLITDIEPQLFDFGLSNYETPDPPPFTYSN